VGEIVKKLDHMGVAAIGFDMVFSEPDRTSPKHVLAVWEKQGARDLAATFSHLPDHDELLGRKLAAAPVVTGFVLTNAGEGAAPEAKGGIAFIGPDPGKLTASFTGSVNSLAALEKPAKGNGALNASLDVDGIIRKLPLMVELNGRLYPTLAAELLRVAQGASGYLINTAEGSDMTDIKIGALQVPVDGQGRLWLHYSHHDPVRYIPAWKLLEADYENPALEGGIAVLGISAASLKDVRATPLNPAMPAIIWSGPTGWMARKYSSPLLPGWR
jgi:adenylate cyclase